MSTDYIWAVNKQKLNQSIEKLRKANPGVEVSETAIKEEYIKRAGLVNEEAVADVVEEGVEIPKKKKSK